MSRIPRARLILPRDQMPFSVMHPVPPSTAAGCNRRCPQRTATGIRNRQGHLRGRGDARHGAGHKGGLSCSLRRGRVSEDNHGSLRPEQFHPHPERDELETRPSRQQTSGAGAQCPQSANQSDTSQGARVLVGPRPPLLPGRTCPAGMTGTGTAADPCRPSQCSTTPSGTPLILAASSGATSIAMAMSGPISRSPPDACSTHR